MHIDIHSRKVRLAAGAAAFLGLVAWLVPPTTPQSRPSPLRAFATIDPHRDDAAALPRGRTATVWSAEAWRRWHAGEAAAPPPLAVPAPMPVLPPPRVAAPRRAAPPPPAADEDRYWEEREAEDRRWAERRQEDEHRWRQRWREERRWSEEGDRWDPDGEDRAYERRERVIERRMRRFPDDDPYYEGEDEG
ncbi:hypothetical protein [Rhizorhabdus dicambivorans]|uniref:Uncharacterized protein n=1 Tax=Rhizorhabdus dicambivorans TaxID=1850238 RepID=A0A2A4FXN6_9SPHN|nr:hypothetical protein [Rhizorhabdus dicambivorans]ATE63340.1 hypothetical protein CMV14_02105 [Rhizorhabdus dicambivorans]PCE43554.1 hypothetical protein COO09_04425 [Rhizorhabdus dicambivorans]